MDIRRETPAFTMLATVIFAHRSRVADSWVALPEVIVQSPRHVNQGQVTIQVGRGSTSELNIPFHSRNPLRILDHRRTIELPGKYIFDSRYDTPANIAHQITSVAMRMLLARKEISSRLGRDVEISMILHRGASPMALALHEQLGIPTIQTDCQVVGELVRVADDQVTTQVGAKLLPGGSLSSLALTAEIFPGMPLSGPPLDDLPERIFIARKGGRRILNEDQVSDLLAGRGFDKFYFEDIPVSRQMRLCRHAKVIVAIHGAAMAHMVFNGNGLARPAGDLSGLHIIELFGPGYTVDLYRRYAAVLNAHWCGVRGQLTPDVIRDLDLKVSPRAHEATPFLIDLETLEMALDYSERASRTPQAAALWSHLFSVD